MAMIVTLTDLKLSQHKTDESLTRRLASSYAGIETLTRPLPARVKASYSIADHLGDADAAHVVLVLNRFGEGDGDHLRVGVASISIDVVDESGAPAPAPTALLRSISIFDLSVRALMRWSSNDDRSPVTNGQAKELLREGAARPAEDAEGRWRRASRVYLEAKMASRPTTRAVIDEFHYLPTQGAAARQLVNRAASNGTLAEVAIEMDLTHLLTDQQKGAAS